MFNSFNITKQIDQLVKSYNNDGFSVQWINSGHCADFANVIWNKHSKSNCRKDFGVTDNVELGDTFYAHTFIKYDGLYYDAECPDGTNDWWNLPLFVRAYAEYDQDIFSL